MNHQPKLCLGTVQFGLPYGVTNQAGQVTEEEVRRILHLAASSGINMLDTAQAYGTAESVLGRNWPTDAPRRLISKLPAGTSSERWEKDLLTSLQRLKTSKLDGFLLHRASDLLSREGSNLLEWLENLRNRGLVNRIGVSIYEAADLEGLPLDRIQLVQIPLSIYDQRLIHDGTVTKLKSLGIAVHARSALLQGLLLHSPQSWPDQMSAAFRDHHARWLKHIFKQGLTPLTGALGFLSACKDLEAVLIGVQSVNELTEVVHAWNKSKSTSIDESTEWSWHNEMDLDPRCWPSR